MDFKNNNRTVLYAIVYCNCRWVPAASGANSVLFSCLRVLWGYNERVNGRFHDVPPQHRTEHESRYLHRFYEHNAPYPSVLSLFSVGRWCR